ncbi:MAG: DUF1592 domain-containing protein [Nannocystaceae bacterium]
MWRSSILMVALAGLAAGCRDDGGAGSGDGSTGGEGSGDSADSTGEADETGDDGTPACAELDALSVGSTPLRRLTRQQYANAVRDLLGVTAEVGGLDDDEKVGPFDSNFSAPVSPVQLSQYRAIAETVASAAVADLPGLLPCEPGSVGCLEQLVASVGRRAFRRPLSEAEVSMYASLSPTGTVSDGARLAIQAMLQSPYFLYHLELTLPDSEGGGAVVPLDDYELASRLSFFLWDSVPDDALLDAAQAGQLADVAGDGLRQQAERLLADPRAREAVASFHEQWLGLDELEHITKDPAVYPDFDAELLAAMRNETRRFTSAVVLAGDGRLETLLTAPFSYLEGPLFELYGVEPTGAGVGEPVALPQGQRAGLLTQASFLTAHAHTNQSGPIQRGVTVRTNLLCTPPPPPPPDIDVVPPDPDPDATTRELFEQHTSDPTCAGCHVLIDGIGLGFEGYDGIGAFRELDNGLPVDQSGSLVGTDVDGEFDGVVELSQMLASSQQVRECVSRQWFRYAFGRVEAEADSCTLEVLDHTFESSGHDVRALLLALVEADAFRYRVAQD